MSRFYHRHRRRRRRRGRERVTREQDSDQTNGRVVLAQPEMGAAMEPPPATATTKRGAAARGRVLGGERGD